MNDIKKSSISSSSDESMEIRRYIGVFISNWFWFVLTMFFSVSLAALINKYSEPVYTVTSSLLIKDDKDGANLNSPENFIPGGDMFRSQQTLQNEIGILKSFSLNLRVMKELPDFHTVYVSIGKRGIAERRYFNIAPFILKYDSLSLQRPGIRLRIRITSPKDYQIQLGDRSDTLKFGERYKNNWFDFSIKLRDSASFTYNPNLSNNYKVWFESPENLANTYRYGLNVQPINKDATLVILSITGNVPEQESEYLNKLMADYISQGLDFKNLTADSTIKFIDRQLKVINDSLTRAEKKLQNFKDTTRMINLSAEETVIQNKLLTYETEKTKIGLQLQYYKYLREYIDKNDKTVPVLAPSLMGVEDPVLIRLVEELGSTQMQRKQLQYNFAKDIPALTLLDSKISDLLISIKENISNNSENVVRALNDVNERITQINNKISILPGIERMLIKFQRDFDINNTVYTFLLEKRSEAGISKASRISGNRIIEEAVPFNRIMISPTKKRNYMIAIIIGILLPGIFVFFVDFFNDKIIDKKDIEKGTSVPVIGYIGHNDLKEEIPVFSKPLSALSESFRTIRTSLKYYLGKDSCQVISITSTISGEGKTFITLNLSAIFAMLGKKTLIVGLDLRKPKTHRAFNSDRETGLSNYLIGESDFEEIITSTKVSNLFHVNSGPIPPNPAELIESPKMSEFLSKAREKFDFIILDTPPVGIVSDALLLASFADINLFIVRQRYSSRTTLEFIQNIYESKQLKNTAIIMNDIIVSGYYGYGVRYGAGLYAGYGYDYGYGQYRSYGYGTSGHYYAE
jgi:capsular exopolysaccharide synthesis family protein